MRTLEFTTRDEWREWLSGHHGDESEAWLVFHKGHTGVAGLNYEAAVEEALCFGWVDSLVKRLDDDRYARKFTPRKLRSRWSDLNKGRAEKMIKAGRMTQAGAALVEEARASGEWDRSRRLASMPPPEMPEELTTALADHPEARRNFESLAPSHRRQYMMWIGSAKKPETRLRRSREALRKLARGEPLGMK